MLPRKTIENLKAPVRRPGKTSAMFLRKNKSIIKLRQNTNIADLAPSVLNSYTQDMSWWHSEEKSGHLPMLVEIRKNEELTEPWWNE